MSSGGVRHALLGLLSERPAHAYQLAQRFEERIGSSWDLNHGQIYQSVKRLERDGLVESADDERAKPGAKSVFRITEHGRHTLRQWLASRAARPRPLRDDLLIKIALAEPDLREDLLDILDRRERLCLERLRDCRAESAATPPLDEAQGWSEAQPALLTRAATDSLEAELEWLRLVRTVIHRHLPAFAPDLHH